MSDLPAFSRASSHSEQAELRIDCPRDVLSQIDAIAMADNLKGRGEWLLPIIERELKREMHRATVLLRCAGINPLHSAASGKAPE